MSIARERFRTVLSRPDCTLAANVFDPLSARIAHMLDYEVCFLSGSVHKVANLALPDIVLGNMSDLVDVCRRITRIADVSLMHDGEDGFGNAVNVVRSVKELEAAGVSAIEIEDAIPPSRFNQRNPGLFSEAEQVGKLEAAVAARTDPMTVIVARTTALAQFPLDEALERIKAYSQTGAEAIRLAGLKTRNQLEAVHRATPLPLTVLSPPDGMTNDRQFLAANGVSILMAGNPAFGMAIQAIYDSFKHMKEGGAIEDLKPKEANAELLRQVNRTDEFIQLQQQYVRD
ncbi:MAG: isocitrate lyase/phosphoenolpyruvate mutase family protein [SAR202 cluster bacterium]|nr:isocitrate lyase/phosphoenolpyruvate mutase family protein [SAR202 cluster bacterium]